MTIFPNISEFIEQFVIKRKNSLFLNDLNNNKQKLIQEISGKSILVVGGAGTIGTSFIKAALKYLPKKLIVVDVNENGLTELTRTLRSDSKIILPKNYITYPVSYDSEVFYKILERHKNFDIVANFAAHKHVRSEKDIFSIEAMFRNNVINAKRFLDYLTLNKPDHFFCVSTDKATNPVNIMGASKKLMENLIMSYSKDIKITTARFANVAFSNGSLLYGFIERLLQRQPISCPSDVRRFFVSPKESGEICLLTCILGKSGEIYFPKLNDENLISFKSITENFFKYLNKEIKLCSSEGEAKMAALNMNENSAYPIYFFETDTSGEKLFEEFYSVNDKVDLNQHESIGVISNPRINNKDKINRLINSLNSVFSNQNNTKSDIVKLINKLIPEFKHIETGKSLDDKM